MKHLFSKGLKRDDLASVNQAGLYCNATWEGHMYTGFLVILCWRYIMGFIWSSTRQDPRNLNFQSFNYVGVLWESEKAFGWFLLGCSDYKQENRTLTEEAFIAKSHMDWNWVAEGRNPGDRGHCMVPSGHFSFSLSLTHKWHGLDLMVSVLHDLVVLEAPLLLSPHRLASYFSIF